MLTVLERIQATVTTYTKVNIMVEIKMATRSTDDCINNIYQVAWIRRSVDYVAQLCSKYYVVHDR